MRELRNLTRRRGAAEKEENVQKEMAANSPNVPISFSVPPRLRVRYFLFLLAPDFPSDVHDEAKLGGLLLDLNVVPVDCAGEAALW
jgi:hypothetical protein